MDTLAQQTEALYTFLAKSSDEINTHKNGSEVRVLVDVHVAKVNQQSHHAVQEADDGDSHKELH